MKDWFIFMMSILLTTSILGNVLMSSINSGQSYGMQNKLMAQQKETEYWKAVATMRTVELDSIKRKLAISDSDWMKLLEEIRDAIVNNVDLRKKIYEIFDASGIDWREIKKDIEAFIEIIKKHQAQTK